MMMVMMMSDDNNHKCDGDDGAQMIREKGGPAVKLSQSNWVGRALGTFIPTQVILMIKTKQIQRQQQIQQEQIVLEWSMRLNLDPGKRD